MRTTIELKDEHRARLLEIAARRGEKGFSALINDAVEMYLEVEDAGEARRKSALALRGRLGGGEAADLRAATAALRETWR